MSFDLGQRLARSRRAWALRTTGRSIILPSSCAAPSEAAAAASTRRAQSTSSAAGRKAACTAATCLGWMHSLADRKSTRLLQSPWHLVCRLLLEKKKKDQETGT